MWKKGIPVVFMSALLLGACSMTNDGAMPKNDETPMEEIDERERNWTPDARDEQRGGADLDGIETDEERGDQYMESDRPNSNNDLPDNERDDRNTNNR